MNGKWMKLFLAVSQLMTGLVCLGLVSSVTESSQMAVITWYRLLYYLLLQIFAGATMIEAASRLADIKNSLYSS